VHARNPTRVKPYKKIPVMEPGNQSDNTMPGTSGRVGNKIGQDGEY